MRNLEKNEKIFKKVLTNKVHCSTIIIVEGIQANNTKDNLKKLKKLLTNKSKNVIIKALSVTA